MDNKNNKKKIKKQQNKSTKKTYRKEHFHKKITNSFIHFTEMDPRPICLEPFITTFIKFTYVLVSLLPDEQAIWADQSRLGTTLSLSYDRLDWPLLEAIISFWDLVAMVFRFEKHELTPTIEELESFLDLKHYYRTDAIFPTHKNRYFKDFQSTFNVSKNFLPKETLGDYLHCPFTLLLDQR